MSDIQAVTANELVNRIADLEKQIKQFETHLELRFRRMWKQDIEANIRGTVNDLVAHAQSRQDSAIRSAVREAIEPYRQQVRDTVAASNEHVREYINDFRKDFADCVAGEVLKILREYWVLDENNCNILGADQRPLRNQMERAASEEVLEHISGRS